MRKIINYSITTVAATLSIVFLITIFCVVQPIYSSRKKRHKQQITILIDPAGDAKNTGRTIDDAFERTVSLQLAYDIKKKIEQIEPGIQVILTRYPTKTLEPLENAHLANRLNIDMYISLHIYHEEEAQPHMYLYTLSYNDTFGMPPSRDSFITYDQAHRINYATTQKRAHEFLKIFNTQPLAKNYICHNPYHIPFKPLVGIVAPALGIEIGLKKSDDWQSIAQPLTHSIVQLLE